jgi:hypothetical protein
VPPAAGTQPATPPTRPTAPSQPPQATREAPVRTQPTPEELERQLLDDTLRRAATPDTSTAGPPVNE